MLRDRRLPASNEAKWIISILYPSNWSFGGILDAQNTEVINCNFRKQSSTLAHYFGTLCEKKIQYYITLNNVIVTSENRSLPTYWQIQMCSVNTAEHLNWKLKCYLPSPDIFGLRGKQSEQLALRLASYRSCLLVLTTKQLCWLLMKYLSMN